MALVLFLKAHEGIELFWGVRTASAHERRNPSPFSARREAEVDEGSPLSPDSIALALRFRPRWGWRFGVAAIDNGVY